MAETASTSRAPANDHRTTGPLSDPRFVTGLRPVPAGVGPDGAQPSAGLPARDLGGVSPEGSVVEIEMDRVGGTVLLAFLATSCDGCDAFWRGLGGNLGPALPSDVAPIIVTRGPDAAAPGEVARLAAGSSGVPVVMSDAAWADYRVLGYPFFVLVDAAARTITAETVAFGWDDLIGFVRSWVE